MFAPQSTVTRLQSLDALLLDVPLGTGHAERRRRLDDRACVLEHVLHRGAELVGVDEDHVVDMLAGEAERLDAHLLDGDAVGEEPDVRERDPAAGTQRSLHRVGIGRLDADDPDLGAETLDVRGDSPDQPAAADGHEDRVDRLAEVTQDLHRDGALAGDHVDVVVRVDEHELPAPPDAHRLGVRVVV